MINLKKLLYFCAFISLINVKSCVSNKTPNMGSQLKLLDKKLETEFGQDPGTIEPIDEAALEESNENSKFMKEDSNKASEKLTETSNSKMDDTVKDLYESELKELGELAVKAKNEIENNQETAVQQQNLLSVLNKPTFQKECSKDYTAFCPQDFTPLGNLCIPLTYRLSDCDFTELTIPEMNEKQKKSLENVCDLTWPCLEANDKRSEKNQFNKINCIRSYKSPCPEEWKLVRNDICKAPDTYIGPCPMFARTGSLTEEFKRNFEIVCFVYWPCQFTCNRNYSVKCPLGWSLIEASNDCLAPNDYKGPLDRITDFDSIPIDSRETYAPYHKVYYPCLNRKHCEIDYSPTCPIGWIEENDGVYCRSPDKKAASNCKLVSFYNLNVTEKQKISAVCKAEFPCKGEFGY